jgi:hypothetical protein
MFNQNKQMNIADIINMIRQSPTNSGLGNVSNSEMNMANLAAMSNQAPTGASIGNVSDMEKQMFQNMIGNIPTGGNVGNISNNERQMFQNMIENNSLLQAQAPTGNDVGNISEAELAAFRAKKQITDNYNSALNIVNNPQLPEQIRSEAARQIQEIKEAYPQLFMGGQ